jgi:hypothetical protein
MGVWMKAPSAYGTSPDYYYDDDGGDDDTQKGLDSVAEEAGEADSLLAG